MLTFDTGAVAVDLSSFGAPPCAFLLCLLLDFPLVIGKIISVVCATKSFMRLLLFHVDEKTVSVETCEERCGNDVLGGVNDASVAFNLSPQL